MMAEFWGQPINELPGEAKWQCCVCEEVYDPCRDVDGEPAKVTEYGPICKRCVVCRAHPLCYEEW